MKTIKQQLSKKSPLSIGIVLLFAATMTFVLIRSFAAVGPANLYTSPGGTKAVDKGAKFTVNVRISTASNVPVAGAAVYMSYPTSKLTVQGVNYSGSPYNLEALETNSGGVLRMDRGALPAVSGGDKLFAKVTFKAVATGTAAVGFTNNSYITSGEDDSDLPLQKSGVTYNISAPSSGGGSSSGPPKKSSTSSSGSESGSSSSSDSTQSTDSSTSDSPSGQNKKTDSSPTGSSQKTTDDKPLEDNSETQALEIVVVDEQQNPVEGAEVAISGQVVKTDENGIARFEDVPTGQQDIVVGYNGNKTFDTVEVKGDSTSTDPESVTVAINRDKSSPIIWIAIPIIGLLAVAGFFFGKPWLNRLTGMFKRTNATVDQSQPPNQSEFYIPGNNPNASPPGSTVSPEPSTPTISNNNSSQDDNI
jgi:hypothetical protein